MNVTCVVLLAAAVTGAGETVVERPLTLVAPGRTVVSLDAPIYERARADLGDLRVRDDQGRQVPYLLDRALDGERAEVRHPEIRNRGFTRGRSVQATLDFGAPLLKSDLTLALSGDNFRRHVVVEGRSRHEQAWTTLTDSAYVFAVPGSPVARYETVALPENNFQILRVTVEHGPDDPERIEIVDAWTRPAGRRRPREVPLEPRMTRLEDGDADETILTLDLGARHQPFRAVVLEVSDERFFRGVSVEARVDPRSLLAAEPARPLAWRHLGEAPIYRYEVGGERHESLRVPVSGRERVLRLRIRNRDDAPLRVGRVTVFVPVERLVFDAAPGRQYTLRYGDPRAEAPRYDLERTAGDPALYAARAASATLQAPREVAVTEVEDRPWTERHPALLWAGLLLVVAAMGGVTWRALRTAG
jgi:hypothetical protein